MGAEGAGLGTGEAWADFIEKWGRLEGLGFSVLPKGERLSTTHFSTCLILCPPYKATYSSHKAADPRP